MGSGRFTVIACDQRTPEWTAARLGRLTGTGAADMLATHRDGKTPSASRKKLLTRLVLERLTGRTQESGYVSAAMQAGIDAEAEAFALYEAQTGTMLERTGFLACDDLMAGCSLDGHIDGFEGIVEIKCPEPHTHLDYLETGKVPGDYLKQVTHALWVTGAAWCDWFSYQPQFPEAMQMQVVRVARADVDIESYDREARRFLAEVETRYRALLGWKGAA